MSGSRLFIMLVSLSALLLSCGSESFDCPLTSQPVTIDGSNEEWQGSLTYFEEQQIALGACHDQEYLYLCLLTTQAGLQMQALTSGMTIWLNSAKSKQNKFGVHYPIGQQPTARPQRPMNQDRGENRDPEQFREEQQARLLLMTAELELLDQDKKILQRMPVTKKDDIQVSINDANGTLIYELAVPLRQTSEHPYAAAIAPNGKIKLTLEIAAPKMSEMGNRPSRGPGGPSGSPDEMGGGMGGDMEQGGMGGGRHSGMAGGGMRGGMGGDDRDLVQQVKLDLELSLSQ
jgi:hypothetical protein